MKTVVVTGASQGIGAACVRALLVQGVRVVGIARSADALCLLSLEKLGGGGRFEYVVGDICEEGACARLLELAGPCLDGLILNAARVDPVCRTETLELAAMRDIYEVNLFANVRLVQMALSRLRASPEPRLIGLSTGIVAYAMQGLSPYSRYSSGSIDF